MAMSKISLFEHIIYVKPLRDPDEMVPLDATSAVVGVVSWIVDDVKYSE